jgi:hypothetical protein
LQTVLGDTIIKTPATHYTCRNANDFLQSARGVHDRQCAGKAIQEQCCSRLVLDRLNWLRELGRDVRQHVISRILRRGRKDTPHYGCGKCAAWWVASALRRSCLPQLMKLTVGLPSPLVDTCTNNHNIVDNGETALACNPLAIFA